MGTMGAIWEQWEEAKAEGKKKLQREKRTNTACKKCGKKFFPQPEEPYHENAQEKHINGKSVQRLWDQRHQRTNRKNVKEQYPAYAHIDTKYNQKKNKRDT